MISVIKIYRGLLLTAFFVGWASSFAATEPEAKSTVVDVTVDQLLKTPARYSGKQIRVRGYWRRGFEWSKLCGDPKARNSPIWIEPFFDVYGSGLFNAFEKELRDAEKIEAAKGEWVVAIVCEGAFEHGETYGHGISYTSRLTINRVIDFKVQASP